MTRRWEEECCEGSATFKKSIPTLISEYERVNDVTITKFEIMAVCNTCHQLYPEICKCAPKPKECDNDKDANTANNTQNHSQNERYRELIEFPYSSVIGQIQKFANKPGFLDLINTRKTHSPGVIQSVQDGTVWRDILKDKDGNVFMNKRNSLMLSLFYDGYTPYSTRRYSSTLVCFAILNLPEDMRFRPENMILATMRIMAVCNMHIEI